jgi:hypothetical protein
LNLNRKDQNYPQPDNMNLNQIAHSPCRCCAAMRWNPRFLTDDVSCEFNIAATCRYTGDDGQGRKVGVRSMI